MDERYGSEQNIGAASPAGACDSMHNTASRKGLSAYHMALGGILLALCIAGTFMSSVMPGVEMTLLLAASAGIFIFCGEAGIYGGFVLYAAACLLSLALVPNKLAVVPLALVFGLYPLVKYLLEKLWNAPGSILRAWGKDITPKRLGCLLCKTVYYAAAGILSVTVFRKLFLGEAAFSFLPSAGDLAPAVLLLAGWVVFLAYDVILSECAAVYHKRFSARFHGAAAGSGAYGNTREAERRPQEAPVITLYHPDENEEVAPARAEEPAEEGKDAWEKTHETADH